jgi:hypothetical protein
MAVKQRVLAMVRSLTSSCVPVGLNHYTGPKSALISDVSIQQQISGKKLCPPSFASCKLAAAISQNGSAD